MFERISLDPNKMSGELCIRNLRIAVATIVTMIAQGLTVEQILKYYPDLEKEDIAEALNFAAAAVREKEIPLRVGLDS